MTKDEEEIAIEYADKYSEGCLECSNWGMIYKAVKEARSDLKKELLEFIDENDFKLEHDANRLIYVNDLKKWCEDE